jgi:hypothetical protein
VELVQCRVERCAAAFSLRTVWDRGTKCNDREQALRLPARAAPRRASVGLEPAADLREGRPTCLRMESSSSSATHSSSDATEGPRAGGGALSRTGGAPQDRDDGRRARLTVVECSVCAPAFERGRHPGPPPPPRQRRRRRLQQQQQRRRMPRARAREWRDRGGALRAQERL